MTTNSNTSGKKIDEFILLDILGKGNFGEVYLAKNTIDSSICAAKSIKQKDPNLDFLMREVPVLKNVNHKNIVKFICVKETVNNVYIFIEYCNGGELAKALEDYKSANKRPFPEELVVYIIKQLVDALYYLHTKKIIHRDIKLENILLNYVDNNMDLFKAQIKLIDFGFAKKLGNEDMTYSICGTAATSDPRIINAMKDKKGIKGGYDDKIDIWSLGVILYNLLVGELPFQGDSLDILTTKINQGTYFIPENISLSVEAICMINGLLQTDPSKRLSWKEIISHPFINTDPKNFRKIHLNNNNKSKDIMISAKNQDISKQLWAMFDNKVNLDLKGIINLKDESISKIFPMIPNEPLIKKDSKFPEFPQENNVYGYKPSFDEIAELPELPDIPKNEVKRDNSKDKVVNSPKVLIYNMSLI